MAFMERNRVRADDRHPRKSGDTCAQRRPSVCEPFVLRGLARLVAVLGLIVGQAALGHGDPTLVTVEGNQLAILAQPATSFLLSTGSELFADDLSFGVNQPEFGPPTGSDIYLETSGGLLYWDGDRVSATDATVFLIPPTADGFGFPVLNEIDNYEVHATSPPQSGMLWGTYRGHFYWHADGLVTMPGTSAPAGVYGVPVRLTSPGFEPSDPFMLTFGWNFGVHARQEGALALQSLLTVPDVVGDYDQDGTVTSEDYNAWRSQFASELLVAGGGADGNGDGRVNLADFVVWRNQLGATTSNVSANAVPEPATGAIAVVWNVTVICFVTTRFGRSKRAPNNLERLR